MINTNQKKIAALNKVVLLLMLALAVASGMTSCKSKKKLAQQEAAAAEARKLAKAKADLESIITNDDQTIAEKEEILATIKAMNIQDEEVQALISKAEAHINQLKAKENAERLAREREERLKRESTSSQKSLDQYFDMIANASSLDQANQLINETMQQFTGPDIPVLIIIAKYGDEKDYDRPTTISKYLNYLKDQKKNVNKVENAVLDASGKIKELELIKK